MVGHKSGLRSPTHNNCERYRRFGVGGARAPTAECLHKRADSVAATCSASNGSIVQLQHAMHRPRCDSWQCTCSDWSCIRLQVCHMPTSNEVKH